MKNQFLRSSLALCILTSTLVSSGAWAMGKSPSSPADVYVLDGTTYQFHPLSCVDTSNMGIMLAYRINIVYNVVPMIGSCSGQGVEITGPQEDSIGDIIVKDAYKVTSNDVTSNYDFVDTSVLSNQGQPVDWCDSSKAVLVFKGKSSNSADGFEMDVHLDQLVSAVENDSTKDFGKDARQVTYKGELHIGQATLPVACDVYGSARIRVSPNSSSWGN